MIQIIRNIAKHLVKKEKPLLGRWQIAKSETSVSQIIKYANEDHCGVCIEPIKEAVLSSKKKNKSN